MTDDKVTSSAKKSPSVLAEITTKEHKNYKLTEEIQVLLILYDTRLLRHTTATYCETTPLPHTVKPRHCHIL